MSTSIPWRSMERITPAPWDLPIAKHRWGRAHFPWRSLVWIDWNGVELTRLVLVDGMDVEGARVTDDKVPMPRNEMTLISRRVLREGTVGGTSVGSVPGVRRALAKAGLLIGEHKWLSSATLKESDLTLLGNAFHEVVRWR